MNAHIVWDVDGNLFRSIEGYTNNFLNRLKEYGFSSQELETAKRYYEGSIGFPISQQFPEILQQLGYPVNGVNTLIAHWEEENEKADFPVYDDVVPCLRTLKERGYRQCASTNTLQHILDGRIRGNGLDEYLDFWLGGTDKVTHKRDHKRPIIERYDLTEEQFRQSSVLVGDGYKDMDIAEEWSIKGVFVVRPHNDERIARSFGKFHAIVHSLTELPEILPEMLNL